MNVKSILSLLAVLLSLGIIGTTFAQNGVSKESDSFNPLPSKEANKKIPPGQKLKLAAKMVKTMRAQLKQTEERFKNAESKERDITKINCINDKLLSIKGNVKNGEETYKDLKGAVSEQDPVAIDDKYNLIEIAAGAVERLADEAALCVGEVNGNQGLDGLTVTPNPDVAPVDPIAENGQIFTVDPITPARIPELTPFQ